MANTLTFLQYHTWQLLHMQPLAAQLTIRVAKLVLWEPNRVGYLRSNKSVICNCCNLWQFYTLDKTMVTDVKIG